MQYKIITDNHINLKPYFIPEILIIYGYGYDGKLFFGEESIQFEDGKTIVVLANCYSGCSLKKKNDDGRIHIIKLAEGVFKTIAKKIEVNYTPHSRTQKTKNRNYIVDELQRSAYSFLIAEIIYNNKPVDYKKLVSQCLYSLVLNLIIELSESRNNIPFLFRIQNESLLSTKITKMIKREPQRKWTLDNVAKEFFVSTATLRRQLASENTAFGQVLMTARVTLALNYLTFSNKSISMIATQCGLVV